MLEFGGEEEGDGGCLCPSQLMFAQTRGTHLQWGGGEGRRGASGLPTGLPLQLLLCGGLWISPYLNNSDKMSVTMATRENKLI